MDVREQWTSYSLILIRAILVGLQAGFQFMCKSLGVAAEGISFNAILVPRVILSLSYYIVSKLSKQWHSIQLFT